MNQEQKDALLIAALKMLSRYGQFIVATEDGYQLACSENEAMEMCEGREDESAFWNLAETAEELQEECGIEVESIL